MVQLDNQVCYLCNTSDFSSGDFASLLMVVEKHHDNRILFIPLGKTYEVHKDIPIDSSLCIKCVHKGLEEEWLIEYRNILCHHCNTKYSSAAPLDENEISTSGWGCDITFEKNSKKGTTEYGGFGSKYDCDKITLLFDLNNEEDYNICDKCIDSMIEEGKASLKPEFSEEDIDDYEQCDTCGADNVCYSKLHQVIQYRDIKMIGDSYQVHGDNPVGSTMCYDCIKKGEKDGTITEYRVIPCHHCNNLFAPSIFLGDQPSMTCGWGCSITFDPDSKVGSSANAEYGSEHTGYTYELLYDLNNKESYNICDNCVTDLIDENKMTRRRRW